MFESKIVQPLKQNVIMKNKKKKNSGKWVPVLFMFWLMRECDPDWPAIDALGATVTAIPDDNPQLIDDFIALAINDQFTHNDIDTGNKKGDPAYISIGLEEWQVLGIEVRHENPDDRSIITGLSIRVRLDGRATSGRNREPQPPYLDFTLDLKDQKQAVDYIDYRSDQCGDIDIKNCCYDDEDVTFFAFLKRV